MSAAFVITLAGIASRFLGLFRDRILAATFGAGDTLDIYYAAFRIPDLIYNLLILGALSAAFIPVFTGLISRDKESEAWKLANGILNLAVFFIIILSVLFAIFADELMHLLTPGFDERKMAAVVTFTRIMFLSPLFLGISGIFGGILTSFKRFLVYALAPILYNIGIILGALYLVPVLGERGLAWGVVLGAFLHMLAQYPAAKKLGFSHQVGLWRFFKNSDVRKVFTLMVPRVLGIAVNQINLLVITIFASTLAAGSLSIFNFAQNLQSVPLGLFGVSFAIAVFPVLSAHAAREEKAKFIESFSETFRQILFFVIPISVIMLVLRAQIVRVVLGTGEFDWEDTILTFQTLGVFSLSLFAQSTIPLLARTFYSLQDTRTPFYIALVTEAVNIAAVLLLIGRFSVIGLAIAFSIANLVQMVLLLFILHTKFKDLDDLKIIISVAKISLASMAAGGGIQLMKHIVAGIFNLDTFVGIFTQLILSGLLGTAIFIGACYLMRLEELFVFKQALSRKLFRDKQVIAESTDEVSGI